MNYWNSRGTIIRNTNIDIPIFVWQVEKVQGVMAHYRLEYGKTIERFDKIIMPEDVTRLKSNTSEVPREKRNLRERSTSKIEAHRSFSQKREATVVAMNSRRLPPTPPTAISNNFNQPGERQHLIRSQQRKPSIIRFQPVADDNGYYS